MEKGQVGKFGAGNTSGTPGRAHQSIRKQFISNNKPTQSNSVKPSLGKGVQRLNSLSSQPSSLNSLARRIPPSREKAAKARRSTTKAAQLSSQVPTCANPCGGGATNSKNYQTDPISYCTPSTFLFAVIDVSTGVSAPPRTFDVQRSMFDVRCSPVSKGMVIPSFASS